MRLDKFLKISRVIKRRSVSKNLIEANRVYVNGKLVKPAYWLKINDIVELELGDRLIKIKIILLKEIVGKNEADQLYEVLEEKFINKEPPI